jgi:hypothetical protein
MVDKYGARQHVVFTDKSGVSNPLGVFDDVAISGFIEMYHQERKKMDEFVLDIRR